MGDGQGVKGGRLVEVVDVVKSEKGLLGVCKVVDGDEQDGGGQPDDLGDVLMFL